MRQVAPDARRESAPGVLRFLVHGATQSVKFLAAYEVHSICTVDAVAIEMRVIEEHPAEVIRQHDVGIEVHPPAVVLKAIKAGVDGGTFVELAAVLAEEIGLHAVAPCFFATCCVALSSCVVTTIIVSRCG